MASEKQVEQLSQLIAQVSSLDIAKLVSHSDWGSIHFKQSAEQLRDLVAMIKPLGNLPIRLIPDSPIGEIIAQLSQTLDTIEKMKGFTLEGDAQARRDAIAGELSGRVPSLYNAIAPHAAFLALYAGDLDNTIDSLERLRSTTASEIATFKGELKASEEEISSIMASAREAAGTAGVGTFSTDFADLANAQDKEAVRWLIVTGAFALCSIGAAAASYFLPINAEATAAQIVQITTSKIVVLGLLLSATYWSSRQFRALRHQIAINRHRANALKTFQAFAKAATDDASRDAVLMETTRSIFAISPSGYLSHHGDQTPHEGLKIIEMIRGHGISDHS